MIASSEIGCRKSNFGANEKHFATGFEYWARSQLEVALF